MSNILPFLLLTVVAVLGDGISDYYAQYTSMLTSITNQSDYQGLLDIVHGHQNGRRVVFGTAVEARKVRSIVREAHSYLNWTDNGVPAWLEVIQYYQNGHGCSAQGTGRCGPVFVYAAGSGCDYLPLAQNPDGINWLEWLASEGVDVYTFVYRGMGSFSSPISGFDFNTDSGSSDTIRVIDYALSRNTGVTKVILMGESFGGNIVFKVNTIVGSTKLCGTLESGAPYHTLAPSFMALLGIMATFPYPYLPNPLVFNVDPVTGLPYPAIGVPGELENEMMFYEPTFNDFIKTLMLQRTAMLPAGPFREFLNFTLLGSSWWNLALDVPVAIINGHDEVVNYTPDIIEGFSIIPAHFKRLIDVGHTGHMGPWELRGYQAERNVVKDLIFEFAPEC
jgi:pimeloyl-ACP methyl ester carboxylesterase